MFRVDKGNSMTRDQIIEVFLVRAIPGERYQLRQKLEGMTTEELGMAYQALQAQAQLEATEEKIFRIQAEAAAEQALHGLRMWQAREPQRLAEEKAQLKTFAEAARTLRSFGVNEANFNVIRSTLGPNFTEYSIREAIGSNAISLSPPTKQELDQWTREAIQAHNAALLNADIPTLRKLTREAGARGPVAPQPDETQRIRAAERVDGTTYPPLPDEFRDGNNPEEVLDAAFIRKCSKETLRLLLKRYGADQVNEALRTRVGGIYQY